MAILDNHCIAQFDIKQKMTNFHFPVLAVEAAHLIRCDSASELAHLCNSAQVLFIVDTHQQYFDVSGQRIERQWPMLQKALKAYLIGEGECCVSKLRLGDESQVWKFVD
ncbi:hypothetical protein [Pseudoalteromonas ruthenica]|uniref:hypothetical protein n=1 Tax=Pseudoalteromonas ruthenica TaxID=151081 RepID=UPI001243F39B|nr:hypothetical protein [Pseudoalteromonas ruthenica]